MLNTVSGKIPIKIGLDATIAPQPDRSYVAGKSALDIQVLRTNADSYSPSNVSTTIQPPRGTMTDKLMMSKLHGEWTFNYTPQAVGVPLFPQVTGVAPYQYLGGTDGLRFLPFQTSCSSAQVTINGTTISQELNQFLEAVNRYGLLPQERENYDSTFPSYQDQFFSYANGFGTNRNPLGAYGDNVQNTPRGAIGYNVVSDNPATGQAVVRVIWYEPIMISPFNINVAGEPGFFDVQTITLNLGLSNMNLAWSHDSVNNPAVINSVSFAWADAPLFETRHCTPITPVTIDYNQLHEAVAIQRFTSQFTSVDPGVPTNANLQNVRLNSMPSKIYVFFKKSNKTINDTDTYAYISNLSVNIGNKSAQLASYTPDMLYKMCVQNGYTSSWIQHSYHTGSVICINLAKDLPMEVGEAVGVREEVNLQISATIVNQTGGQLDYDGQLVILSDAIFSVGRDGGSSLTVGPLNMADVLAAGVQGAKASEKMFAMDRENFYASGKIDWKSTGRKLVSFGKKYGPTALKAIDKYGPDIIRTGTQLLTPRLAGVADEALKLLGKGYTGGQAKKYLKGMYPNLKAKELQEVIRSIYPTRGGRCIGSNDLEYLVSDFDDRI